MIATDSRKPKAFQVHDSPERLEIRWSNRELYGRTGVAIVVLILAIFAPVILWIFWNGAWLTGIAVLSLWLYVLYAGAVTHFNDMAISVDGHHVRVEEGPYPWPSGKVVELDKIERIEAQYKHPSIGSDRRWSFVYARLKNRRSVLLVSHLPSRDPGEFLRDTLAARLPRTP